MGTDATDALRQALLELNEQVKPMHEWLAGQRSYFLAQGYTDDEARAMSAAEFVTMFGTPINRRPADG
ncbi:hypothetical protein GCM10010172_06570 [Paractinoplanes ferrugineus]|uniref:Uncharacterized protein n=1 Tax=Paractinoplanes ferrugineus TaxID=113564 RepID=A0A919J848_9ACTN|nr:hypothetical protein [Actinoplanes ferrugineus]GIE16315.1 hypothetical protein Afe05nite_81550 [Actinoplanes ferrugineus]